MAAMTSTTGETAKPPRRKRWIPLSLRMNFGISVLRWII